MIDLSQLSSAELSALVDDASALIEGRRQAEEGRAAVQEAVRAYAESQGLTVLQAWRDLVPEGVQVPDDPDPAPVPDAPEYVPPTGAHDAYDKGDLVTFEGAVYECLIDGCVWSPAAYPQAWKEVARHGVVR